jgi:hypothetical protein
MLILPAKRKKVKINFPFFPKFFLLLFGFLKNAKDEKSNMLWKRRILKWWIFGERECRGKHLGYHGPPVTA